MVATWGDGPIRPDASKTDGEFPMCKCGLGDDLITVPVRHGERCPLHNVHSVHGDNSSCWCGFPVPIPVPVRSHKELVESYLSDILTVAEEIQALLERVIGALERE